MPRHLSLLVPHCPLQALDSALSCWSPAAPYLIFSRHLTVLWCLSLLEPSSPLPFPYRAPNSALMPWLAGGLQVVGCSPLIYLLVGPKLQQVAGMEPRRGPLGELRASAVHPAPHNATNHARSIFLQTRPGHQIVLRWLEGRMRRPSLHTWRAHAYRTTSSRTARYNYERARHPVKGLGAQDLRIKEPYGSQVVW